MVEEKKKKRKLINPFDFKDTFKEDSPERFDIGKKIKKTLKEILDE